MAGWFEWNATRWRRKTGIRQADRRGRRRRQRGAALLLVVWIFIVLFVVVLDFASSMRDDGLATANLADETQVYYIAVAGLNRAVYDVLTDPNAQAGDDDDDDDVGLAVDEELGETEDGTCGRVTTNGRWYECDFAGGSYAVRVLDESSKLGLNALAGDQNVQVLKYVVTWLLLGGNATEGVGVTESREIETVVDSILDWYDDEGDEEITRLNGAEADYYSGLSQPYPIKNGRFDSLEELLLVRGVTPELFYGFDGRPGLREVFSVDSKTRHINVMQAPAAVLRVLLRIDEEEAQALVTQREEEPFGFVQQVQGMVGDPMVAELLRGGRSPRATIEARGMMGDRVVAHVAAMVDDLDDDFEGPTYLKWFDRVPADWAGPGAVEDEGT